MTALLMAGLLAGLVLLSGVCVPPAPSPVPPAPSSVPSAAYYSFEESAVPNSGGTHFFDFTADGENFFTDTKGAREMETDAIKDRMRRGIVEKSIEILRRHGKSDEEIQSILLKDFQISRETLHELLNKNAG